MLFRKLYVPSMYSTRPGKSTVFKKITASNLQSFVVFGPLTSLISWKFFWAFGFAILIFKKFFSKITRFKIQRMGREIFFFFFRLKLTGSKDPLRRHGVKTGLPFAFFRRHAKCLCRILGTSGYKLVTNDTSSVWKKDNRGCVSALDPNLFFFPPRQPNFKPSNTAYALSPVIKRC